MYIIRVTPTPLAVEYGLKSDSIPVATKEQADSCIKNIVQMFKKNVGEESKISKDGDTLVLSFQDEDETFEISRISLFDVPVDMKQIDIEVPEF